MVAAGEVVGALFVWSVERQFLALSEQVIVERAVDRVRIVLGGVLVDDAVRTSSRVKQIEVTVTGE